MNLQRAAAAATTFGQAFRKDIRGLSSRPDQASARIFHPACISDSRYDGMRPETAADQEPTAQLHMSSWQVHPSWSANNPHSSLPVL